MVGSAEYVVDLEMWAKFVVGCQELSINLEIYLAPFSESHVPHFLFERGVSRFHILH
jgi:hypothetical protein